MVSRENDHYRINSKKLDFSCKQILKLVPIDWTQQDFVFMVLFQIIPGSSHLVETTEYKGMSKFQWSAHTEPG